MCGAQFGAEEEEDDDGDSVARFWRFLQIKSDNLATLEQCKVSQEREGTETKVMIHQAGEMIIKN